MAKVIMHVDLNYFFVRCEELKNPTLVNKPVMIGGVGRCGIVSTCSYAARKFGVHSGMPSFKAIKLCPKIIILPGDYKYYSLMSREFFAYVKTYTHKVEQASIDECYMDITEVVKQEKDVNKFLERFQKGLFNKTGLMCSVGVAPTRFLAKMASDFKKPMGITIIRKKEIPSKIYPLPVDSFFGIGKKSAPRLNAIGINSIGDLANFIFNKEDEAINYFGSYYYEIKDCLTGNSSDEVITEYGDPKSIGNSTTLMSDTDDEDIISSTIYNLAKEVSDRARSDKLKGRTIQLVIKDPSFKVFNKSKTLDKATNDYKTIHSVANALYLKYFRNISIRLVGVTLQHLTNEKEENVQLSFFEDAPIDKTNEVIDKVNSKFKRRVVMKGRDLLKGKFNGN